MVNLTFWIFQISDIRERHYEKMGIGSSYLFRLDDGYVVSIATMIVLRFGKLCTNINLHLLGTSYIMWYL